MTTPINSNGSASSAAANAVNGNGTVSDMFTKLLVAQIKNQDPMSPQDPSAMVTQLTQMSQMEALQKLNDQGAANANMLSSLQMLTLGSQVGTTVQAYVDQLHVGTEPIQASVSLASTASPATLVVKDASGTTHRIDLGQMGIGRHDFVIDPAKLGLAAGDYQVHIEDESKQGTMLEVVSELSSVRLSGSGGARLTLGSLGEVDPGAITEFKGRVATTTH